MTNNLKKPILEVLEKAKKREIEAFNYYYKASLKACMPETESLLLQLAEEERRHRLFLEREIEKIGNLLNGDNGKGGDGMISESEVAFNLDSKPYFIRLSGIEGIDIAGTSLPTELLGGDFIQTFRIRGERNHVQGILLFDVMGHGLQATHLKAEAKQVMGKLEENAAEAGIDLRNTSQVMTYLNKKLLKACQEAEKFISGVYAVLDPETGQFCYTSAGHDPPVLFSKQGYVPLEETDLLLGASADYEYSEISVRLVSGDLLIFYTDGISEAEDYQKTQFGRDGIVESVEKGRHTGFGEASAVVATIWEALHRFIEGRQMNDDFTMAAIRFL